MNTISTELDDSGILTVMIDVPGESMNVINQELGEDFNKLAEEIESNHDVKAVVITSGKKDCFVAGADIKMLEAVTTAEMGEMLSANLHQLILRMGSAEKPFIAAIDGVCLGGGYEIALSCHYRIASDSPKTKIGLPEVMLGLLPGGGGNTKLPRLIDLPKALDLLLTGKQLNSKRAKKTGLIDEVVPQTELLRIAKLKAKQFIDKGLPERKVALKDKLMKSGPALSMIIGKARSQVLSKTKGIYPAPLAILDVIEQGLNKPLEDALKIEARNFGKLTVSPEAAQLMNIYFATTELKKETFGSDGEPIKVNNLGILGGGLMGAGIATVSIDKAGASARIKDIRNEGLLSAFEYLGQFYKKRVKRKAIAEEAAKRKMNQLTGSLDYSGFNKCELIIEAVFEKLELKHQMIADIEALGNEKTVFATNTSSLPITDIAAKAARPENILGMHYFSPVEKMPLLEIITHPTTSAEALATAIDFGRKQGKTVIVVKDGAGFYVNRILAPYINQATKIGAEGVALDKIDDALLKLGFPVGPYKLLDEVGLDVGSKVQPILEEAFGERMKGTGVQQTFIEDGRIGKKVKKGFYRYDDPDASKEIDPAVYALMGSEPNNDMDAEIIAERCVITMINEAVRALEEGIIEKPMHGDIGAIFGIGFPPVLGGPFRYADTIGISTLVEKLKKYQQEHGAAFEPAQLLLSMAEKGETFYS